MLKSTFSKESNSYEWLGEIAYKCPWDNIQIYPAKTAFTDQYSLPNIFFDIGQL